jgi:hypothetical protein
MANDITENYYILEENIPVKCTEEEYWYWKNSQNEYEDTALGVAIEREEIESCIVSTVFLGNTEEYSAAGNPLVFETYVHRGKFNGLIKKYPTMEQAITGHMSILEKVMAELYDIEEDTITISEEELDYALEPLDTE